MHVYSTDDGELLWSWDVKGEQVEGLGISPDAKQLLLKTGPGFDLVSDEGKQLHHFALDGTFDFRFTPDGKSAFAWKSILGGKLHFLDLIKKTESSQQAHKYKTKSFAFTPDGRWGVTGGMCRLEADRNYYFRSKQAEGGEVILWDLPAQKPVAKINACFDTVGAVHISADGKRIIAVEHGDDKGNVIVINVKSKT
jgi:hypothetical protein